MAPEGLAVLAAFGYGSAQIASRRGTDENHVVPGMLISLVVSLAVLLPVVMVNLPDGWSVGSVVAFALAGIIGPALARWMAMVGVQRLGAAVSVAIQSSTYPCLAVLLGLLWLGEGVVLIRLLGLLGIVTGVILVVLGRIEDGDGATGAIVSRRLGMRMAFVAPLAAGGAYAVADLLRKSGLAAMEEPVFAAVVGLMASTAAWGVATSAVPGVRRLMTWNRSLLWFALMGLLTSGAQVALMNALAGGELSVVSPIVSAQPIVVMLLTPLFLRRVDILTKRVKIGIVIGVTGIVLTGLGS